jgi:hypothetical protein
MLLDNPAARLLEKWADCIEILMNEIVQLFSKICKVSPRRQSVDAMH